MSEHQTKYQDEINLFDLIEIIWNGKWIIIAFTVVFGLFGLLALIYLPKSYTAELEIKPLEFDEVSNYIPINSIDFIGIDSNNRPIPIVTSNKLIDLLVSETSA